MNLLNLFQVLVNYLNHATEAGAFNLQQAVEIANVIKQIDENLKVSDETKNSKEK